jgi:hypothetical protein
MRVPIDSSYRSIEVRLVREGEVSRLRDQRAQSKQGVVRALWNRPPKRYPGSMFLLCIVIAAILVIGVVSWWRNPLGLDGCMVSLKPRLTRLAFMSIPSFILLHIESPDSSSPVLRLSYTCAAFGYAMSISAKNAKRHMGLSVQVVGYMVGDTKHT